MYVTYDGVLFLGAIKVR